MKENLMAIWIELKAIELASLTERDSVKSAYLLGHLIANIRYAISELQEDEESEENDDE